MKPAATLAATLALVSCLAWNGVAHAGTDGGGRAYGTLTVVAVVLERCRVTNDGAVTVACRRGVAWEIKPPRAEGDEASAATHADAAVRRTTAQGSMVQQVYF